jgi:hypothetical protein
MSLFREAVLGPAFTPGSLIRQPLEPFRFALRLAAFGGETQRESEDTNHASRRTRPVGQVFNLSANSTGFQPVSKFSGHGHTPICVAARIRASFLRAEH